jgi:hydrogenase maturation factor HypF (carbamoyltransferase family)
VVARRQLAVRERRNLKIRGIVQGVFFRETVRRTASRYDVRGFVRNIGFDALEIEAEGEPKVVNSFIEDILAHPPRGARIEDVRSTAVPLRGDERFSVTPSIR